MRGVALVARLSRSGVIAPVLLIAAVVVLGAVAGWPGWWVSTAVIGIAGAIAAVVVPRRLPSTSRAVSGCVLAILVATSAGAVASAAIDLHDERQLHSDRSELRREAGGLICRILTRGTDADRTAARAAATGELAQRLASVVGAADSETTQDTATGCVPVTVGLGAVTEAGADVVVAVNLTDRTGAQDSSSGRVAAAHLARVGGTWKVATLDLIR